MLPARPLAGQDRYRDVPLPRLGAGVAVGAIALVLLGAAAIAYGPQPWLPVLAFAALLAVPLVLGDVNAAFVALVAVIMLLPFAAIPLGIGFNPTLLDPALGVLYLILVMRLVTRETPGLRFPPLSSLVLLFMGLMLAALLAGMAHGVPTKNQFRVFGELLLGAGLFFVIGNLVHDTRRLRLFFLAIVGLAALSALVGLGLYLLPDTMQIQLLSALRILDYPTGAGVLRYLNDDPTRLQRATGTAIDPNSFGGMLAMVTALLLPQLLARRPWITRRVAGLLTALLCLALLATVSRGSLLGLGAGVAVILLARDRRLLIWGILAFVAILAIARALPLTAPFVDHFLAGFAGGYDADRATQMRMGEYKDALRLIERYPWFGIGFGGPKDVDLYRGVSSLYLILAETMGVVGASVFVGVIGTCVARLAWAWRAMGGTASGRSTGVAGDWSTGAAEDDGLQALLLGCLAGLVTAMVSGLFDHYFFTYPHAFALLWLVVGVGMCGLQLRIEASQLRIETADTRMVTERAR